LLLKPLAPPFLYNLNFPAGLKCDIQEGNIVRLSLGLIQNKTKSESYNIPLLMSRLSLEGKFKNWGKERQVVSTTIINKVIKLVWWSSLGYITPKINLLLDLLSCFVCYCHANGRHLSFFKKNSAFWVVKMVINNECTFVFLQFSVHAMMLNTLHFSIYYLIFLITVL
jgi:hypothetical protein